MKTSANLCAPDRAGLPTVSRRSSLGRRILRIARIAGIRPDALVIEMIEAGAFAWEDSSDYRSAERAYRRRVLRRRATSTRHTGGRR